MADKYNPGPCLHIESRETVEERLEAVETALKMHLYGPDHQAREGEQFARLIQHGEVWIRCVLDHGDSVGASVKYADQVLTEYRRRFGS